MRLAPALALVAAAVCSAAAGAGAQRVTIEFRLSFTSQAAFAGSLAGTFAASGAFHDSGRVTETYSLSLPRRRDQQPVQTLRGRSTLTGRDGTLRGSFNGIVSSASPRSTVTEGRWTIAGGTGAYAGIRGSGRLSAVVDLGKRTMVKRYDGLASR